MTLAASVAARKRIPAVNGDEIGLIAEGGVITLALSHVLLAG
jgi:hypothetical protein